MSLLLLTNMKSKILLLIPLAFCVLTACQNQGCNHQYDEYYVTSDSDWYTYIVGSDFDSTGLEVRKKCAKCGHLEKVEFTLEDDKNLALDQESVGIIAEGNRIDYQIKVKEKFHIACVGDSLTAGHMWPNESYPTYLSEMIDPRYEVKNCGVNGISITGWGGSWSDPNMRYIKQDVYQQSVDFAPDIFAIMLGTNDATEWEKAKETFYDEYIILLESYINLFPHAKFIMMVSPPVVTPNQFNIPNDEIRDYVNPYQRELAEIYDFELLDLREEFEEVEDFASAYLRPNNDNVHFTKQGAQYVAARVWAIAKDLTF